MELMMTLSVLAVAILLYFAPSLVNYWNFMKKAESLPTSKYYPILRHIWHIIVVPPNRWIEQVQKLFNRSPSPFIFWLGPVPVLVVLKARHVEIILSSMKYIDKPFHYGFLEPWLGTGLLTSTGKKWQSHRKMITPTFHFKILENFAEVFADKSRILVDKLEKEVGSKEFEMSHYITLCALDIICETAMGIDMKAQSDEQNSDYVDAVMKITDDVMNRIFAPWLYPDILHNLSSSGRRLKKHVRVLHRYSNKVIRERKLQYSRIKSSGTKEADELIGSRKKMAFLDLLLKEEMLTDEEIREEVDTFMFEGHDTTTSAISWTLQLLASHPDVQEKVFKEIERVFQGSDRTPSTKDLNELKYLERVIKESLRLYPSVPAFGRDLKEDVEIDGIIYPAGVKVVLIPYFIHRMADNFPDPETFNPDNFLPEKIMNRNPYAYIPFSAGPRNCIGQKFAMLEEKMMLTYIIRKFKLEATRDIPVAIPLLILRPNNGIYVKITHRS